MVKLGSFQTLFQAIERGFSLCLRSLTCELVVVQGMLYLHSCSPPIIHRDLKSPNLLVDKHWRIKVR